MLSIKMALRLAVVMFAYPVLTSYGQQCCTATVDCSPCNSGNYKLTCNAPVVTGETGCNCNSGQGCSCAKCCWSWTDGGGNHNVCNSVNCQVGNPCTKNGRWEKKIYARTFEINLASFHPGQLVSAQATAQGVDHNVIVGVDDDPRSGVTLSDPALLVNDGALQGMTATLTNNTGHPVIAYEVFWTITTNDGYQHGSTTSSDLIFDKTPFGNSETMTAMSTMGGIPVSVITSVIASVSYYQTSDGVEVDSQATKIASEFARHRASAAILFKRLAQSSSEAAELSAILADKTIASDKYYWTALNELKGALAFGGPTGLQEYVAFGLRRLGELSSAGSGKL